MARAAALFHRVRLRQEAVLLLRPVDEPDGGDPHACARGAAPLGVRRRVADAAILFVRAHLGRGHGLERRRSGAELRRGASYGTLWELHGHDATDAAVSVGSLLIVAKMSILAGCRRPASSRPSSIAK